MTSSLTIQGELRLPAAFLQDQPMEEIERRLLGYGLLPTEAQARRWRMDPETPGGFLLMFTFVLTPSEEPPA